MIKTLKITSLFAVVAAVGFVTFLGVFGLKGDEEIEKFLNVPGVVETFKKLATKTDKSSDQISPLVKQAQAFARIINPPPPPKPKSKPKKTAPKKITKSKPVPPKPKVPVNTKFKLIATCRYEKDPTKSMALLDMPAKGLKWFRQGEEVNHLIIEQIEDGNIVLYKSGKENSRISMPVVKKRSLLKSNLVPNSQPDSEIEHEPVADVFSLLKAAGSPDKASAITDKVQEIPETVSPRPKPRAKKRTLPRRKTRKVRTAPPEPTLEERKTSIDDSIKRIRSIMNSSEDDQQADETKKTWMGLLKSLETERKKLEKPDNETQEQLREESEKTQQKQTEKSETNEPDTNGPQD